MQKYGQHFLINQQIIAQIADAALLLRAENLVEIGPGKGALTHALAARGQRDFYAIEIDPEMVNCLQKDLPSSANIRIIEQNFLTFDLATLPQVPTEFVSNLPYIDAAAILDKVLSWPYFKTAVFMFQKEQAQKIMAKPEDELYGALSVLSQLRARMSLVCNVGRGSFNPPPKVESRVLAFERVPAPDMPWKKLHRLVTSSFLHRRKTLLNAL
ncbi:MAG: ribosomal RNA small subunit methyltransferase A, partial [Elusimicrobiaceae bacterium]|nr:ribosomal RNA small subunit methyltransferase A [Elusimicrobiaceae bacterium]